MEQTKPLPPLFQTFFVSREVTGSTQIDEMIHCGHTVKNTQDTPQGQGSLSVAFGTRVLITGEDAFLPRLSHEDIVELVDYDPMKNVVLAAGKTTPCKESPMH